MTKRKRPILLIFVISLLLIILISILSWTLYKQSIKSLLNTSIDGYAVLNFNAYSKNKNAQFLAEEIAAMYGSESAMVEVNKYIKFLDNVFVLHLAQEDISTVTSLTGAAIIAGFDAGPLYIPAVTQLGRAFDKIPDKSGIYVLNKKIKKDLGVPDDFKLYLKPYRGVFLVSLSDKNIRQYFSAAKKSKRNEILSKDYAKSKDEMLFFGGNFKKTLANYIPENVFIKQIDNINGRISFDPYFGKIVLKLNISGTGELFSHLSSSAVTDRPLLKYIKPGSIYLANNNFTKFIRYISDGFNKMQDVDYLMAMKTLLGFDITDIIKLCGPELIIGTANDEYYAMTQVKEKLLLQAFLGTISSQTGGDTFTLMDKPLYLKDNLLFFNSYWDKYDSDIFITKETFFYTKMPISKFNENPLYDTSYIEIDGRYDPSYNVMVYIKLSKEDLKRLLIN